MSINYWSQPAIHFVSFLILVSERRAAKKRKHDFCDFETIVVELFGLRGFKIMLVGLKACVQDLAEI